MPKKIPIYDLKEVQDTLKINVRTLREYVKKGDLKAKKIGRTYYVTENNLREFVER